ncbi:MAG TPA: glutathione S-transferase family protein [Vicinamibacterales bacterium]|nr:glutathione S-transferase family protein [Vicinamibacterales bacterium]
MEPVLLYGVPAGSSMGLIAALEWLGKPYRLCRVDMLGEMRTPAYARINARHETPVLITEAGRPLTETMAIAAWLEARDDQRRISFEPLSPAADRMHQMLGFINTGFTASFSPLWAALEMSPPDPQMQDCLRRYGRPAVIERHDKLEAMLDDRPYLAGEHPTLADAVLVGVARWLEYHQVERVQRWPKLARLRARLEADPAVQFALAIENGGPHSASRYCRGQILLADVIAQFGTDATSPNPNPGLLG